MGFSRYGYMVLKYLSHRYEHFDNVNHAAMVQLRRTAVGALMITLFLLAPCCGQTFFEVGPA
jgi:hypothetical protein